MNGYLLDTDICIFFLQGKYGLAEKIEAVGIENCFVSEITLRNYFLGLRIVQIMRSTLKK